MWFCDATCQRVAWPIHKAVCQPFAAVAADGADGPSRFGVADPSRLVATHTRMTLDTSAADALISPGAMEGKTASHQASQKKVWVRVWASWAAVDVCVLTQCGLVRSGMS